RGDAQAERRCGRGVRQVGDHVSVDVPEREIEALQGAANALDELLDERGPGGPALLQDAPGSVRRVGRLQQVLRHVSPLSQVSSRPYTSVDTSRQARENRPLIPPLEWKLVRTRCAGEFAAMI